jgi:hypothetical protein
VFARKLVAEYDLLLIARRRDRLEALATELRGHAGSAVDILAADLANEKDLALVADRLAAETNLGLLVNNAGFGTTGFFWEADFARQEEMHRLHVLATVRLCHAALGKMVAQDFGGVINVASVASFVRTPGSTSYGATKSWMAVFTEGLYLELQKAGSAVRVQALCPGYTHTEFHDVIHLDRKRVAGPSMWLRAEDVADASLDGLRKRKLYVVPGWRYQLAVSILTKLPTRLRIALELALKDRRKVDGA